MGLIEALVKASLWLSFKHAQARLTQEQLSAILTGRRIELIEHDQGHSYAVAVVIHNGLVWGVAQRMAVDIQAGRELYKLWLAAKRAT